MNALCLVLNGENIALLTIVKDYRVPPLPPAAALASFLPSQQQNASLRTRLGRDCSISAETTWRLIFSSAFSLFCFTSV